MKEFSTDKIRNVALVGHGGTGKTSLLEAILFAAKVTNRMGIVDDGTTTSDYTEDEITRKISIGLALGHLEWKSVKINFVDTPGYADFSGEMYSGLSAADFALNVVNGVAGPEVGTDIVWRVVSKSSMPTGFFVNRMDKEHADFAGTVSKIQSQYGDKAVPVTMAWGDGVEFKGVIDIISMKAFTFDKSAMFVQLTPRQQIKGWFICKTD